MIPTFIFYLYNCGTVSTDPDSCLKLSVLNDFRRLLRGGKTPDVEFLSKAVKSERIFCANLSPGTVSEGGLLYVIPENFYLR